MLNSHNVIKIKTTPRANMPTPTSDEQQIQQFNTTLLEQLHGQLPKVSEAEIAFNILKRDINHNQNQQLLLKVTLQRIEKCPSINALRVLKDYFNHQAVNPRNDPTRTRRYINWTNACDKQVKALLPSMDQENIPPAVSEAIVANTKVAGIALLKPEEKESFARLHRKKARFTVNSAVNAPSLATLTNTTSLILEVMDQAELLAVTQEDFASLNQQLQQHLAALPQKLAYTKHLSPLDAINESILDSAKEETHLDSLELCVMAYRDNKLSQHSASIYTQALTQAKQEALSQNGFWKVGAPNNQQQPNTKPPLHIVTGTKRGHEEEKEYSPRKSQKSPPSPYELCQTETESAASLLLRLSNQSDEAKPSMGRSKSCSARLDQKVGMC
jgi:hypothetical protein